MKYSVTMVSNYDADVVECCIFDDYAKATAYLHWSWENYYNEAVENDGQMAECYYENEFAKVSWVDKCEVIWVLTFVSEPPAEFTDAIVKKYMTIEE